MRGGWMRVYLFIIIIPTSQFRSLPPRGEAGGVLYSIIFLICFSVA